MFLTIIIIIMVVGQFYLYISPLLPCNATLLQQLQLTPYAYQRHAAQWFSCMCCSDSKVSELVAS